MTVAVILAKGDSRRIPKKNSRLFCGEPLFTWSVRQAVNSQLVDKVVVSTDDDEIEGIAMQYPVTVIRRPKEDVQAGKSYLHAIECIKLGLVSTVPTIDYMVGLLPTSPIRMPDDIDGMVQMLFDTGVNIVDAFCRQLETILYKKTSPTTAEYFLFDKKSSYFVDGGGMHASKADWMYEFSKGQPEKDSVIDANPGKHARQQCTVYELAEWQTPELDLPEHWGEAEAIMEKCILEPFGRDCYEKYGGKNGS